jgi:hypothetical protein
VRVEGERGEQGEGQVCTRSLKRLRVLQDAVNDADDDAWGGSLADPVCEPY